MVTTLTTTSTTVPTDTTASLVAVTVLVWVILVIIKEMAGGIVDSRSVWFSRALNSVIVPLSVVLLMLVVSKMLGPLH